MPQQAVINMKKYLENFDSKKNCGVCLKCKKHVQWCFARLKSHKKACEDEEFNEELRLLQEEESKQLDEGSANRFFCFVSCVTCSLVRLKMHHSICCIKFNSAASRKRQNNNIVQSQQTVRSLKKNY